MPFIDVRGIKILDWNVCNCVSDFALLPGNGEIAWFLGKNKKIVVAPQTVICKSSVGLEAYSI